MATLVDRLIADKNTEVTIDEMYLATQVENIDWPGDTLQEATQAAATWYQDRLEVLQAARERRVSTYS